MRGFCQAMCFGLLLVVLGLACAHTAPTQFYLLSGVSPATTPLASASDVRVGILPVQVAAYLEVDQVVQRRGENQLALSEFERWAEPLEAGIARVLRDNLTALSSDAEVVAFPWSATTPPPVLLSLQVSRFEADADSGEVTLLATWSLRRGDQTAKPRQSTIVETVSGAGVSEVVAAMSRALAKLAGEIADNF